jgi:Fic family protein
MPINFRPYYEITPETAKNLMQIESLKEKILYLPLTPTILKSLRESARLFTTHYSTMIEGNRLNPDQIESLIKHKGHFPGREREEHEIKGYYAALEKVEQFAALGNPLTEKMIQELHALVMGDGRTNISPTPYRDGQNVIKDGQSGRIVYMPPEAKDVSPLMQELVQWIKVSKNIPAPIIAGIAHYQFATIHPYYDGNGRTARLLTNLILHMGGYDLKGLYSLEEYYARHLGDYYEAINIGDLHNYYMGRADASITKWVDYFIQGMKYSFENVLVLMKNKEPSPVQDKSILLRKLDPKKRKALDLLLDFEIVSSKQVGELFGFKERTSRDLCAKWVKDGFIKIVDPSKKGRAYTLADQYLSLIKE